MGVCSTSGGAHWRTHYPPPVAGAVAGILQRISWEGEVVWTFEDDFIHHDFTELPGGTLATLA